MNKSNNAEIIDLLRGLSREAFRVPVEFKTIIDTEGDKVSMGTTLEPGDTPDNQSIVHLTVTSVVLSAMAQACTDGNLTKEGWEATRELIMAGGMLLSKIDTDTITFRPEDEEPEDTEDTEAADTAIEKEDSEAADIARGNEERTTHLDGLSIEDLIASLQDHAQLTPTEYLAKLDKEQRRPNRDELDEILDRITAHEQLALLKELAVRYPKK